VLDIAAHGEARLSELCLSMQVGGRTLGVLKVESQAGTGPLFTVLLPVTQPRYAGPNHLRGERR
jgi:hypothetical protein